MRVQAVSEIPLDYFSSISPEVRIIQSFRVSKILSNQPINPQKSRGVKDNGDGDVFALDKGGVAADQALPRCTLLHCRFENYLPEF